jgi:cell pole-organizing protein PopZ
MTNAPPPAVTPDGADPSMEEILASIRRILNDDDLPATAANSGDATPVDNDVLVLDEAMMVAAPGPVQDAAEPVGPLVGPVVGPLPEAEESARDSQQEMEAVTPTSQDDPRDQSATTADLVAPEAAAAAASSVSTLMRSLAAGRATQVYSGGPTLEDIVRAELRPLLKEWLNVNLPPVVERLVRAEIERVVGRAVL